MFLNGVWRDVLCVRLQSRAAPLHQHIHSESRRPGAQEAGPAGAAQVRQENTSENEAGLVGRQARRVAPFVERRSGREQRRRYVTGREFG